MKPFRILKNNIKDAFKSVFRNFSLSIASISCISITLALVAVAMLLTVNVEKFTSDIEKDVTIVVSIERETTEEEIQNLKAQIEEFENIDTIKFISNEEIKKSMSKESDELANILGQYNNETNPLLNEYEVKVKDVETIGKTAKKIKELEHVYSVKYGEGMVEQLVKIFNIVKKVMYTIVIALGVVTLFLISNTIKITINNRQRQIEIERLVGASNSYIKRPYFFEGIILGFLGSLLPILISCWGYIFLYEKLDGVLFTSVITLVNPDKVLLMISIALMIIGTVVGAFASYHAVRRYLKI